MCEIAGGERPLRTEQGSDDRRAVGRVGSGSRLGRSICGVASCADRRHPDARSCWLSGSWPPRRPPPSARTGAWNRCTSPAWPRAPRCRCCGRTAKRCPRRPRTALGGLLFRNVAPGSRYRVRLSSTGEESGPITVHTQTRGAVGSQHLQTVDPEQRIPVPDDARRHPAGDRRPPADLPADEAQRRGIRR